MEPDREVIGKVADATKAVADLGTQNAKVVEKVWDFISRMAGEPANEAAGMLTDRIQVARFLKRLDYADKVTARIKEKGIDTLRTVPPKFLLPAIDAASLEDNAELNERWVRLLTSAIDPSATLPRQVFIGILQDLEPIDVKILDWIYGLVVGDPKVDLDNILQYSVGKQDICNQMGITSQQYEISIFNLFRSQCMAPGTYTSEGATIDGYQMTTYLGSQRVTLTPLGIAFVASVQP